MLNFYLLCLKNYFERSICLEKNNLEIRKFWKIKGVTDFP